MSDSGGTRASSRSLWKQPPSKRRSRFQIHPDLCGSCPPARCTPEGRNECVVYLLSDQTGRTGRPKVAEMMSPAAWYQAKTAKASVTHPPAFVMSGWLAP
jgi:hypothetical protein